MVVAARCRWSAVRRPSGSPPRQTPLSRAEHRWPSTLVPPASSTIGAPPVDQLHRLQAVLPAPDLVHGRNVVAVAVRTAVAGRHQPGLDPVTFRVDSISGCRPITTASRSRRLYASSPSSAGWTRGTPGGNANPAGACRSGEMSRDRSQGRRRESLGRASGRGAEAPAAGCALSDRPTSLHQYPPGQAARPGGWRRARRRARRRRRARDATWRRRTSRRRRGRA